MIVPGSPLPGPLPILRGEVTCALWLADFFAISQRPQYRSHPHGHMCFARSFYVVTPHALLCTWNWTDCCLETFPRIVLQLRYADSDPPGEVSLHCCSFSSLHWVCSSLTCRDPHITEGEIFSFQIPGQIQSCCLRLSDWNVGSQPSSSMSACCHTSCYGGPGLSIWNCHQVLQSNAFF